MFKQGWRVFFFFFPAVSCTKVVFIVGFFELPAGFLFCGCQVFFKNVFVGFVVLVSVTVSLPCPVREVYVTLPVHDYVHG